MSRLEGLVKMLVGYARVSSSEQSLDRQIDSLLSNKVNKRNIYLEKSTGTKRDRPELNRMIGELEPQDIVVVSDLTRLSRSTKDLFEIAEQIRQKGADIKSLKESWLDTTTPQGKLMFTIFAGLSQFERDLISERTREGLKAAKARGRSGGRPSKRNEKGLAVELLYSSGMKISEIVRQTDLSRSTVNRIMKDVKGRG
jgi:DNA invertase Pin-like site-specific DNA recombinase